MNMKKIWGVLGWGLFGLTVLFGKNLFGVKSGDAGIKVVGVIDGDTIVLEGKVKLRLRQIDAPELEFCWGEESKQYLDDLVTGKYIEIKEKTLDQMGRDMALVYVDGKLVNEMILAQGMGRYHSDSTTVREDLKTAQETAKTNSLGLFSPKCYQQDENIENPKCNIKANIDKNTKERVYYLPGCVQYKTTIIEKDIGEDWYCSEKEALEAGYRKSERCP